MVTTKKVILNFYYVIITSSFLLSFIIEYIGTPVHPLTNSFESKASLCSIIQNTGYAGLRELSQNTNPVNTELLVRNDDKRTRRSREKIVETKKKNVQRLRNQKQFASKGKNLATYKGAAGAEKDENEAPSKSFLCSQASNMSIHSQE